ncbi:MAG TPA: hypothetical protein VGC01_04625 [Mucilaginibacter sp.]
MKKNKFNIFCAWTLLICFIAGQYMVYVHQHTILQKSASVYRVAKNHPKPAVTMQEKCYMCDAMHHAAITADQLVYFNPILPTAHIYSVGDYDFVSIALLLSAGRAPPVCAYFC